MLLTSLSLSPHLQSPPVICLIAVTHRYLVLSSLLPWLSKSWYHSRVQYCLRYLFSSEKWIQPPITLEKDFYILSESFFNNISVLHSSYLTMFDSCMPQLLKSYFGVQISVQTFFFFYPILTLSLHAELLSVCWCVSHCLMFADSVLLFPVW